MAMVATPAASNAVLVPPVEIISQPSSRNFSANATIPVLSLTLISARFVNVSLLKY